MERLWTPSLLARKRRGHLTAPRPRARWDGVCSKLAPCPRLPVAPPCQPQVPCPTSWLVLRGAGGETFASPTHLEQTRGYRLNTVGPAAPQLTGADTVVAVVGVMEVDAMPRRSPAATRRPRLVQEEPTHHRPTKSAISTFQPSTATTAVPASGPRPCPGRCDALCPPLCPPLRPC